MKADKLETLTGVMTGCFGIDTGGRRSHAKMLPDCDRRRLAACAACSWFLARVGARLFAAEPAVESPLLANLSFEQLSQIEIITSSKRPEALTNVPAAVRVVTGDEIVRSGATTIPETLRLVPGLNVAQINGSAWGIGARGFQAQYANKLLVMMDGRSIYTPVFGGVNWELQDYLLEDLDRVEVVLGPGSSIWGANAMNGVINILTKPAKDTLGGLAYGGGGNEKLALAGGRYGWKLDENIYGRVYVKYGLTDDTRRSDGSPGDDSTEIAQAGFRLDGEVGDRSQWTLDGAGYAGQLEHRLDQPSLTPLPNYSVTDDGMTDVSGAHLLGKWETAFSPDSNLRLQGYYDYIQRTGPVVDNHVQTVDFELQHTWSGWERHKLDWGLGYRWVSYKSYDSRVTFDPPGDATDLFSGFVQDEWWLVEDRLALTAGAKLEHHESTGFEPQPNVRLAWHPGHQHTLWAAWSRAVRTPSRVELSGMFDAAVFPPGSHHPTLPVVVRVADSTSLDSERLEAWELGWRWQASRQVSLELAGFYYDYNDLILITPGSSYGQPSLPALIVPEFWINGMDGHSYGGEVSMVWDPVDCWRLRASYAHVQIDLTAHVPDAFDFSQTGRNTPQNTFALRSSLRLGRNCDFDAAFRYVDEMPGNEIPAYVELDARLAWRPHPNWEVALVGQNLLHDHHPESRPSPFGGPTEIQRSVYAKLTVRF